jgi:alpha-mannosidase
LTIADKSTGSLYRDLLAFRDYGEIGDGWYHQPPLGNPVSLDNGRGAEVEIFRDGSEICVMKVTKYIRPPAWNGMDKRSGGDEREIRITSFITLTKTSRWVEVDTIVSNTRGDHKLTVSFPTECGMEFYEADQPFAVVRRRAGSPDETGSWKEYDRGSHAFSGLVIRRDEKTGRGLAFLSRGGMHECFAHADSKGVLEITLFRSFGRTFLTKGEEDGQLLGKLEFHFALLPLDGNDSNGSILKMRNLYAYPPLDYTVSKTTVSSPEAGMEKRGFSLESENIVLSVLKQSRVAGFICLRLVNYSEDREEAKLLCPASIVEAYATDFLEEEREPLYFKDDWFSCTLDPYKIGTFLLRLKT